MSIVYFYLHSLETNATPSCTTQINRCGVPNESVERMDGVQKDSKDC